jgi:hypothetical protein
LSKNLTAPMYESATVYHPPVPAPFEFNLDSVSIEELYETPATREILTKHATWALAMAQSELFKPFQSNFTVRDMAAFFPGDHTQSLIEVDTALRQLPRSEWPLNVR